MVDAAPTAAVALRHYVRFSNSLGLLRQNELPSVGWCEDLECIVNPFEVIHENSYGMNQK